MVGKIISAIANDINLLLLTKRYKNDVGSWVNLLKLVPQMQLEKISCIADLTKESSPLTQMRYIRTAFEEEYYDVLYKNNPHFDTDLINSLVMLNTPHRSHIGVKSIVTYNFDNLVEKSLDKNNVGYRTIYREDDIADNNKFSVMYMVIFWRIQALKKFRA